MALELRVACLWGRENLSAARQLRQALSQNLPKREGLQWQDVWRAGWAGEPFTPGAWAKSGWADLIVVFGSARVCERIAAVLEEWRSGGKTVLWLLESHVAEPMCFAGVEFMQREHWEELDPIIIWVKNFAERMRGERETRAEEEERRRIRGEVYRRRYAVDANPFDVRHMIAMERAIEETDSKARERAAQAYERAAQARQKRAQEWQADRDAQLMRHWRELETRYRSGGMISASVTERPNDLDAPVMLKSQPLAESGGAKPVTCSVYSPRQWEGRTTELVQVWFYEALSSSAVEAEAQQVDPLAERLRSQVLGLDIAHDTDLSVALQLDLPCTIDPPLTMVRWRGEPVAVSFGVQIVPVQYKVRVLGTLEIRINHSPVPAGVIHFRIEFVPEGSRTEDGSARLEQKARATESVFVSYASEDRAEVLRRVQGLKALGIEFFQDILSLAPGDRWQQELWRHIDQSDVFLLCWSRAAAQSEWVRREYLKAHELSQSSSEHRPHITILPLEGPPPPAPPVELEHLHFSDDLLYALKVESDLAASRKV
jgi:hypothetical protein